MKLLKERRIKNLVIWIVYNYTINMYINKVMKYVLIFLVVLVFYSFNTINDNNEFNDFHFQKKL